MLPPTSVRTDPVIFHPGSLYRNFFVKCQVFFSLGMNEDISVRFDSLPVKQPLIGSSGICHNVTLFLVSGVVLLFWLDTMRGA